MYTDISFSVIGTTKDLHKFLNEINTIHPNIKFTLKHSTSNQKHPEDKCDCDQSSSIARPSADCGLPAPPSGMTRYPFYLKHKQQQAHYHNETQCNT